MGELINPSSLPKSFWALKNATADVSLKKKAAALGAIDTVVTSMRRHASRTGVQQQGCAFLFNLAVDDDNVWDLDGSERDP